jgi:hypothetical protein
MKLQSLYCYVWFMSFGIFIKNNCSYLTILGEIFFSWVSLAHKCFETTLTLTSPLVKITGYSCSTVLLTWLSSIASQQVPPCPIYVCVNVQKEGFLPRAVSVGDVLQALGHSLPSPRGIRDLAIVHLLL